MGTDWDESSLPYADPRNRETAMNDAPDRYLYVIATLYDHGDYDDEKRAALYTWEEKVQAIVAKQLPELRGTAGGPQSCACA
jgi:hypothetical protein